MQGFREYVRTRGHSLWLHNATYWFLPEYPREARDKGLTGKGVAVVKLIRGLVMLQPRRC
jgi:hypothetical protein